MHFGKHFNCKKHIFFAFALVSFATGTIASVCVKMDTEGELLCHRWMNVYIVEPLLKTILYHPTRASSLPPANEVCEGYVFTRFCHSDHGGRGWGVVSQHGLQVWGEGIPACLAGLPAHTQGEVEGSGRGGSRPTPRGS